MKETGKIFVVQLFLDQAEIDLVDAVFTEV